MTAFGSVTICASPHFLKLSLHFEAIAVVGCAFFRVDNRIEAVRIGTALPVRDVTPLIR
jgi:hypothetical protein